MDLKPLNKINSNNIFVPLSYYAKDFTPDFKMYIHRHSYLEVMYCKSGSFIFETLTPDSSGKLTMFNRIPVKSGEFVMTDSGIYHQIYIAEGSAHIMNIELNPETDAGVEGYHVGSVFKFDFASLIKQSKHFGDTLANKPFILCSDSDNVGNTLTEIIDELSLEKNTIESAVYCQLLTCKLFMSIGRCATLEESLGIGISYVKKAMRFIKDNFTRDITTTDISTAAGVNKSYLQRLFKQHTGINILQSINKLRVEKSKNLLTSSSLSSAEIALQSGFKNRQHFIYEFKKFTGRTPFEYKANVQNKTVDYSSTRYYSDYIVI